MSYLVTALYGVVFSLTLPACFVGGVLVYLVTWPFDRNRLWMHTYVSLWGAFYMRVWPGWRVRVEGRERVPEGACILVANHQSAADIFAALSLLRQFKFVSKGSLFSLPLVGWLMWMAGYVAVERGRPRSMQEMLERCRVWLRRGVPVLLFPEGGYAPEGTRLPFKRGPFRLALEEQVPVVPVVLEGTTAVMVGDGPRMGARAEVRVRVLPPLPVESLGSDEGVLAERVRALYVEALAGDLLLPDDASLARPGSSSRGTTRRRAL
jgi:1-acyl-sn-glycerol-3-phosphate acyltransferase